MYGFAEFRLTVAANLAAVPVRIVGRAALPLQELLRRMTHRLYALAVMQY